MRRFVGFATVVSACSSGDDAERVHAEWSLQSVPTADRLPITVHIGSGGCNTFDAVLVTESTSEVRVEAFVNHRRRDYCTLDDVMKFETVDLASPLRSRRLVGCYVPASEQKVLDQCFGQGRVRGPRGILSIAPSGG